MVTKRQKTLEERLNDAARHFPYPPTPESRLIHGAGQMRKSQNRLRMAAAAAAVLLTLILVPPVRAAVVSLIQVGVITILGDTADLPDENVAVGNLPLMNELLGQASLADVQNQVDFEFGFPQALGQPDVVFFQNEIGPVIFLIWLDGNEVLANLTILGPGVYAWKVPFGAVESVEVRGVTGVWLNEPHPFYLRSMDGGDVEVLMFDAASVLIWEEGQLTYRLEGDFSAGEAVRFAESIGGTK